MVVEAGPAGMAGAKAAPRVAGTAPRVAGTEPLVVWAEPRVAGIEPLRVWAEPLTGAEGAPLRVWAEPLTGAEGAPLTAAATGRCACSAAARTVEGSAVDRRIDGSGDADRPAPASFPLGWPAAIALPLPGE